MVRESQDLTLALLSDEEDENEELGTFPGQDGDETEDEPADEVFE